MVSACTDNSKFCTGEVDIIQQFCIGCVVTLIYQIGKPYELVGRLYLIEAVNQRGHAGIYLAAVDTDAILILVGRNILRLGIRIGKG